MLVQLLFVNLFFHYVQTITSNSSDICRKVNLCRNENQSCYPVVSKCQNNSCSFQRFSTIEDRYRFRTDWFYDTNYERCRRSTIHIENFVYFRFLRDCRRFCPIRQEKRNEQIVTLHVSEIPLKPDDTVYVQLKIDFSSVWTPPPLADVYQAQTDYFQNYRRRFAHFIDPLYQLMLNQQYYTGQKTSK